MNGLIMFSIMCLLLFSIVEILNWTGWRYNSNPYVKIINRTYNKWANDFYDIGNKKLTIEDIHKAEKNLALRFKTEGLTKNDISRFLEWQEQNKKKSFKSKIYICGAMVSTWIFSKIDSEGLKTSINDVKTFFNELINIFSNLLNVNKSEVTDILLLISYLIILIVSFILLLLSINKIILFHFRNIKKYKEIILGNVVEIFDNLDMDTAEEDSSFRFPDNLNNSVFYQLFTSINNPDNTRNTVSEPIRFFAKIFFSIVILEIVGLFMQNILIFSWNSKLHNQLSITPANLSKNIILLGLIVFIIEITFIYMFIAVGSIFYYKQHYKRSYFVRIPLLLSIPVLILILFIQNAYSSDNWKIATFNFAMLFVVLCYVYCRRKVSPRVMTNSRQSN